jgi:hypothetical protein
MTRSGFDGLVCAVLLKQLDHVELILNRTSAAAVGALMVTCSSGGPRQRRHLPGPHDQADV